MLERKRLLVAYEMGLGKTPITIAAVENLLDTGKAECGFVVAQSSLKYQWKRQIENFAAGARVLVIDGDPKARKAQYRKASKLLFEYVILSFDNVVRDFDMVKEIPIDFMVVDEATWIKSFRSQRSRKVKQLKPEYRFALTGQPVENRPEELFSIMQWVDPKVLGNFVDFERTFIQRYKATGIVRNYRNLKLLNETMGDAMVRATWDEPEVAAQMPKVVEECEYVEWDGPGQTLYRRIGKELLQVLRDNPGSGAFNLFAHYGVGSDDKGAEARGEIMARITAMSQLCCAPELLLRSANEYEESIGKDKTKGSKFAYDLKLKGQLAALKSAPKLDAVAERIVDQLDANENNKVVVFSQYPLVLKMVEAKLGTATKCTFLTGDMSAEARDRSRQQFMEDPYTRVFLSTDAGGYGVDLPNANYLHNIDLPWSAGKMRQRNARIIRLSSEFKNVTLINWLMRGSIEERKYDALQQKQAIASAWVDGKGISGKHGSFELTLGTLTEFLQEQGM